jgi:transposase
LQRRRPTNSTCGRCTSVDWRRLDARIADLSNEIEALARQDQGCERLMSVPGIGPIISSAMVAAIGTGDAFSKGRDFGACPRNRAGEH